MTWSDVTDEGNVAGKLVSELFLMLFLVLSD